jgi:hypothetical protein
MKWGRSHEFWPGPVRDQLSNTKSESNSRAIKTVLSNVRKTIPTFVTVENHAGLAEGSSETADAKSAKGGARQGKR